MMRRIAAEQTPAGLSPADPAGTSAAQPEHQPQAAAPASGAPFPAYHGYRWGSAPRLRSQLGVRQDPAASAATSGSPQLEAPSQPSEDFANVDPAVMKLVAPLLTGNAIADRNIVRFYEHRAQLLRRQQPGAVVSSV